MDVKTVGEEQPDAREHQSQAGSKPAREQPGAKRLKEARTAARFTQEQLASAASVHVRTVRNLESGRITRPRRANLESLASILGMGRSERDDFISQWTPIVDPALSIPAVIDTSSNQLNELARNAMSSFVILALDEVVEISNCRMINDWATQEVIEARLDDVERRIVIYQPENAMLDLNELHLHGLHNCFLEDELVFSNAGVKVFILNLQRRLRRGESHLLRYRADFGSAYQSTVYNDRLAVNEAVSGFLRPPRSYVLEVHFSDVAVPTELVQIFQPTMSSPIREIKLLIPDSKSSVHIGLVEPRAGAHGIRWKW